MKLPDLSKVISPDDVSRKGNGSYAADYVNWAKVSHYLLTEANGWQFHLRSAPSGDHVWKAPNGTGYLVGYFTDPDGQETADFPQSVMDNKNNPIPFDRISARDVTDTHRRALCAAACFTFGLAYQLWAKEKIEDPHCSDEPTSPTIAKPVKSTSKPKAPPTELEIPATITTKEAQQLYIVASDNGWTEARVKEVLAQSGITSAKDITANTYLDWLNYFKHPCYITKEQMTEIGAFIKNKGIDKDVAKKIAGVPANKILATNYDAVIEALREEADRLEDESQGE